MTVLSFHNRHLGYALTWAALSVLAAAGAAWLWRGPRARHPRAAESTAA
jgi:cytochrome oxidase assembly protein ShyY1